MSELPTRREAITERRAIFVDSETARDRVTASRLIAQLLPEDMTTVLDRSLRSVKSLILGDYPLPPAPEGAPGNDKEAKRVYEKRRQMRKAVPPTIPE